jgi:acyl-CoA reductase-like NAD-dependent aldehyde dehydrogenase
MNRNLGERLERNLLEALLDQITLAAAPAESRERSSPMTGEKLVALPLGGVEDIEHALATARAAQRRWATLPPRVRAQPFKKLHDLILDRREEACDLVQLETGKARRSAMEEVLDVAIVARHYAFAAPCMLRPRRRKGALPLLTSTVERAVPLGVVGMISPWNYPLTLAVTDAIPALIAGNGVVLKPAEETSLTALWLRRLVREAGLPPDLYQVVTGTGAGTGAPLAERAEAVMFTGSSSTGAQVAATAAGRLAPVSLELGGKNAMLVLADAPLRRTVEGAVNACFANAGQLCISMERIYVHHALYERFLDAFGERVRAMKVGVGYDWDLEMGSIISRAQMEKIRHHVDDAVEKGARIVAGGRERPDLGPLVHEPTVLADVTPEMTLFTEETFGPVVSVYPFTTVEEAIERANATEYGLNASIWTGDTALGRRIAGRLQAGTVNVNEGYAAAWASVDAPMGGFKRSGLGRRHGRQGLLKYTEPQTVAVQRGMPLSGPAWLGAKRYATVMAAALRLLKRIPGLR